MATPFSISAKRRRRQGRGWPTCWDPKINSDEGVSDTACRRTSAHSRSPLHRGETEKHRRDNSWTGRVRPVLSRRRQRWGANHCDHSGRRTKAEAPARRRQEAPTAQCPWRGSYRSRERRDNGAPAPVKLAAGFGQSGGANTSDDLAFSCAPVTRGAPDSPTRH